MTLAELRALCAADWRANAGYPKSRVVLLMFRTSQYLRSRRALRPAYLVAGTGYKVLTEWVMGIELPASTSVGPALQLRHGVGLVVNPHCVIGADVVLRHGVTLGNRRTEVDCPVVEDGVEFGAGATAIGSIVIGAGARIGAGTVVVSDVPAGAVVYLEGMVVRTPSSARAVRQIVLPDADVPDGSSSRSTG